MTLISSVLEISQLQIIWITFRDCGTPENSNSVKRCSYNKSTLTIYDEHDKCPQLQDILTMTAIWHHRI